MNQDKFNSNSYKDAQGKVRVKSLMDDMQVLFNDIHFESGDKSKHLLEELEMEMKKLSKDDDISFKLPRPDDKKISDLSNMVYEYKAFNSGSGRDLTETWKKYLEYFDYKNSPALSRSIESLDNQHYLIEQIPENRIQSKKIELLRNVSDQNKTRDKIQKKQLVSEFVRITNQVRNISYNERISDTSLNDVKSFEKFIKLENKVSKTKRMFVIGSITFALAAVAGIVIIFLI